MHAMFYNGKRRERRARSHRRSSQRSSSSPEAADARLNGTEQDALDRRLQELDRYLDSASYETQLSFEMYGVRRKNTVKSEHLRAKHAARLSDTCRYIPDPARDYAFVLASAHPEVLDAVRARVAQSDRMTHTLEELMPPERASLDLGDPFTAEQVTLIFQPILLRQMIQVLGGNRKEVQRDLYVFPQSLLMEEHLAADPWAVHPPAVAQTKSWYERRFEKYERTTGVIVKREFAQTLDPSFRRRHGATHHVLLMDALTHGEHVGSDGQGYDRNTVALIVTPGRRQYQTYEPSTYLSQLDLSKVIEESQEIMSGVHGSANYEEENDIANVDPGDDLTVATIAVYAMLLVHALYGGRRTFDEVALEITFTNDERKPDTGRQRVFLSRLAALALLMTQPCPEEENHDGSAESTSPIPRRVSRRPRREEALATEWHENEDETYLDEGDARQALQKYVTSSDGRRVSVESLEGRLAIVRQVIAQQEANTYVVGLNYHMALHENTRRHEMGEPEVWTERLLKLYMPYHFVFYGDKLYDTDVCYLLPVANGYPKVVHSFLPYDGSTRAKSLLRKLRSDMWDVGHRDLISTLESWTIGPELVERIPLEDLKNYVGSSYFLEHALHLLMPSRSGCILNETIQAFIQLREEEDDGYLGPLDENGEPVYAWSESASEKYARLQRYYDEKVWPETAERVRSSVRRCPATSVISCTAYGNGSARLYAHQVSVVVFHRYKTWSVYNSNTKNDAFKGRIVRALKRRMADVFDLKSRNLNYRYNDLDTLIFCPVRSQELSGKPWCVIHNMVFMLMTILYRDRATMDEVEREISFQSDIARGDRDVAVEKQRVFFYRLIGTLMLMIRPCGRPTKLPPDY